MNVLPREKLTQAIALFEQGETIRRVADMVGAGKVTINKYRQEWIAECRRKGREPMCPCGKPVAHRGWCRVRYEKSLARQEFVGAWHDYEVARAPGGINCRACGGVWAQPPSKYVYFHDICQHCNNKFEATWKHKRKEPTAQDLNAYLARRLELEIKHFDRVGVGGRCEAMSTFTGGYQCGMRAEMERDGHRVCKAHGRRALSPIFVDEVPERDQYAILTGLLADLAVRDPLFRAALQGVDDALEFMGGGDA